MNESRRIGILGLARSGRAAAELALSRGHSVFASDAGDNVELRASASAIRRAGGEAEVGGHTIEKIAACDLLVVSPGIPPEKGALADERVRAVPRISELEFAFHYLTAPVIGVTGTNGKSTTTAWIAHLLATSGFDAPTAGNIGTALSEIVLREQQPDWVVVEASSFQLADIQRFAPRIGVLTNLAPDHLDRYPDVETYYADKAHLFDNATNDSMWILNGEDERSRELPGDAAGTREYFRVTTPLSGSEQGGFVRDGVLYLRVAGTETELLPLDELALPGAHNVANALAASLAAIAAGASVDAIRKGLRTFSGLEHRLERIVERDGVVWINDSKATNIASTLVAVRSMRRPMVLLLGGRHKGEPYTPLIEELSGRVRTVVAYGEAAQEIVNDLGDALPVERVNGSFEQVVSRAAELAQAGDVVLLSPACSSYDMFRNYEERGRRFRELAITGGITTQRRTYNGMRTVQNGA